LAYLATRCPPGHVYHAARGRTGTQRKPTPHTSATTTRPPHARPHGAPSLFLCLRGGRGDRTESNSGRRRVPTCRWRCSQLLPHCPPDTSRTGLLGRCRLLSPRRHARTPTAGAGQSVTPPARAPHGRACWISSARRVRERG